MSREPQEPRKPFFASSFLTTYLPTFALSFFLSLLLSSVLLSFFPSLLPTLTLSILDQMYILFTYHHVLPSPSDITLSDITPSNTIPSDTTPSPLLPSQSFKYLSREGDAVSTPQQNQKQRTLDSEPAGSNQVEAFSVQNAKDQLDVLKLLHAQTAMLETLQKSMLSQQEEIGKLKGQLAGRSRDDNVKKI